MPNSVPPSRAGPRASCAMALLFTVKIVPMAITEPYIPPAPPTSARPQMRASTSPACRKFTETPPTPTSFKPRNPAPQPPPSAPAASPLSSASVPAPAAAPRCQTTVHSLSRMQETTSSTLPPPAAAPAPSSDFSSRSSTNRRASFSTNTMPSPLPSISTVEH